LSFLHDCVSTRSHAAPTHRCSRKALPRSWEASPGRPILPWLTTPPRHLPLQRFKCRHICVSLLGCGSDPHRVAPTTRPPRGDPPSMVNLMRFIPAQMRTPSLSGRWGSLHGVPPEPANRSREVSNPGYLPYPITTKGCGAYTGPEVLLLNRALRYSSLYEGGQPPEPSNYHSSRARPPPPWSVLNLDLSHCLLVSCPGRPCPCPPPGTAAAGGWLVMHGG
jgi:hypothetical protein